MTRAEDIDNLVPNLLNAMRRQERERVAKHLEHVSRHPYLSGRNRNFLRIASQLIREMGDEES
jgi:hypothetical protein